VLELAIRLVLSLSVVLGLLLLLARIGGRKFRGRSDAMVQILHRQHLTRGSTISVVSVGSKVLVLGTTENQVRVLTELDPDEVGAPQVDLASLQQTEQDPTTQPTTLVAVPNRDSSPLAGSVLSVDTWKQALAAATRRAS
jgi:flagellar protein FliO/FliZ